MLFPYTEFQMQSEERLAPGKVCRKYHMFKLSRSMYGAGMKSKANWEISWAVGQDGVQHIVLLASMLMRMMILP